MEAITADVAFFDLVATVSGSADPAPGHRHTRYTIDVVVPGSNRAWTIHRRYHEFKRLHNALYSLAFPGSKLPARQLWGPRSKVMQERRAESLDMWLQGTLAVWKSFYAPGDDEASLVVTSLLTVFLCRDQEFVVSHAMALTTSSSAPPSQQDENSVQDSSVHGGVLSHTNLVRHSSFATTTLEQASSSDSQEANGGKKFQRFLGKMAKSLKAVFSISVHHQNGTLVSRDDEEVSPPQSTKLDSPTRSEQRQVGGGFSSSSTWMMRGRMMFRRKKAKPKRTVLTQSSPSHNTGERTKGKKSHTKTLSFFEGDGDMGKPLLSPMDEGSVHRVYAAQSAPNTPSGGGGESRRQTSPQAIATCASESDLSHLVFNQPQPVMRKIISMTDDDGSELEWVFDSEDEEEGDEDYRDQLFLGNVVAYEDLECSDPIKRPIEHLFKITLEIPSGPGGVDILKDGFGMVSVPPSPRSREVFRRPWKAYTDKLLYHVQRRLDQLHPPTTRSRASSLDGQQYNQQDWLDSGSEEGGSEAGDELHEGGESVFLQRAQWLSHTFQSRREAEINDQQAFEDDPGYDSEGWASEAANDSYDGGNDREVFGSWEDGTIWIGPKRKEPDPVVAPPATELDSNETHDEEVLSAEDSDAEESDEQDDDDDDDDDNDDDDSGWETSSSYEDDDEATDDELTQSHNAQNGLLQVEVTNMDQSFASQSLPISTGLARMPFKDSSGALPILYHSPSQFSPGVSPNPKQSDDEVNTDGANSDSPTRSIAVSKDDDKGSESSLPAGSSNTFSFLEVA